MTDRTNPIHALIPAAGRGVRFGSRTNKLVEPLGGVPVIARALEPFFGICDSITVIGRRADLGHLLGQGGVRIVPGGASRQESVRRGLESLSGEPDDSILLVHDAARPFVTRDLIVRCVESASTYGTGIAAVPVHDTVRRARPDLVATETVDRTGLWAIQTPQAFRLDLFRRASKSAALDGFEGTDEASLVERLGEIPIRLVMGERENIKITTSDDLRFARGWRPAPPDMRVGCGYDIHRMAPGRELWLGGVRIPHDAGLEGHSDADAALHAICDALLGAAGLPDIGQLYPNTDPSFAGAASIRFLEDIRTRLEGAGWSVMNVDCTIVAERPKIAPHVPMMRERIAAALGIELGRVGLKATTNEGLDAAGAGEGIACHAAACLMRRAG